MLLVEISQGNQLMNYIELMDKLYVDDTIRLKMEKLGTYLFKLGMSYSSGIFTAKNGVVVYPYNTKIAVAVGIPSTEGHRQYAYYPYADIPADFTFDDVKKWVNK
jgi:hypothetical protein